MSNEKVNALLGKLRSEIDRTALDGETLGALKMFEEEIANLLDEDVESSDMQSTISGAQKLEDSFAEKHPTVGGMIREIVDLLGKMGLLQ